MELGDGHFEHPKWVGLGHSGTTAKRTFRVVWKGKILTQALYPGAGSSVALPIDLVTGCGVQSVR